MKIVIVPMWLTKVLECNGLSKSCLLDMETLSTYLSKKDLQDYARLPYMVAEHFKQRYQLDLAIQHPGMEDMPGANLHVPCVNAQTGLLDRIGEVFASKEPIEQQLIGHHLTDGMRVDFDVELFTTKDSEDVVGLFARVAGGPADDPRDASARFLEDLAGILYARNHSLQDLCAEGILGAYINHVG